jgi:di/tricarboxylate transporter
MPYAITLMMGASCAFINPAGFQTNLMVQGPGGYRFGDFAKMGLPLTVIVAVLVLLIVPFAYPF